MYVHIYAYVNINIYMYMCIYVNNLKGYPKKGPKKLLHFFHVITF